MLDTTKKASDNLAQATSTPTVQSESLDPGFSQTARVEQLLQRIKSSTPGSQLQREQDISSLKQLVGPLRATQLLTSQQPASVLQEEATESLLDIDYHFSFDYNGDGEKEQKRLYFKQIGSELEFIINPDPVPFEGFIAGISVLKNDPTIKKDLRALQVQIFGYDDKGQIGDKRKDITVSRGQAIKALLVSLANQISNLKADEIRPETDIKAKTAVISYGSVSETINNGLVANPLTSVPPSDAFWTGYKPNPSSTPFMDALNNEGSYVRGHMLNAQLYGPGEDRNLVPISSKTNSQMKSKLEDDLKDLVNGGNRVLYYSIKPRSQKLATGVGIIDQLPAKFDATYCTYTYKAGPRDQLSSWQAGAPKAVPLTHIPSREPRTPVGWKEAKEKKIGPGIYTVTQMVQNDKGNVQPELENKKTISSPGRSSKSKPNNVTTWQVSKFAPWTLYGSSFNVFTTNVNTFLLSANGNNIIQEVRGKKYCLMPTAKEINDTNQLQETKLLPEFYKTDDGIWETYIAHFESYEKAKALVTHPTLQSTFSQSFHEEVSEQAKQGHALYGEAKNAYDKTLEWRKTYKAALIDVNSKASIATSANELEDLLGKLADAQAEFKQSRISFGRVVRNEPMEHAQAWSQKISPLYEKYKEQLTAPLAAAHDSAPMQVAAIAQTDISTAPQASSGTTLPDHSAMPLASSASALLSTDNSGASIDDYLADYDPLDYIGSGIGLGFQHDEYDAAYDDEEEEVALEKGKRQSEQSIAIHEGIATIFTVGHAHGDKNACLISSLIQHAKAIGPEDEPSKKEVEEVRMELVAADTIDDEKEIDIASKQGASVIQHIEHKYSQSLKVIGLLNGKPDVEIPISEGTKEAIIYLAPGHFIPVWRKPPSISSAALPNLLALPSQGAASSQSNLPGFAMDTSTSMGTTSLPTLASLPAFTDTSTAPLSFMPSFHFMASPATGSLQASNQPGFTMDTSLPTLTSPPALTDMSTRHSSLMPSLHFMAQPQASPATSPLEQVSAPAVKDKRKRKGSDLESPVIKIDREAEEQTFNYQKLLWALMQAKNMYKAGIANKENAESFNRKTKILILEQEKKFNLKASLTRSDYKQLLTKYGDKIKNLAIQYGYKPA
jgi:hypothetical protein